MAASSGWLALVAEEFAPAEIDVTLTSVLGVEVCFNDPGRAKIVRALELTLIR